MGYLFNPENYKLSDDGSIPNLLMQHLNIVFISLLIALVIALPLGLLLARYRFLYAPVITLAGIAYTIPAMALISFLILLPFSGLSTTTIIIPLVLYAQLSLIRNTTTAIWGVDPLLLEVGRSMGMSRIQVLLRVTLPLALPVIIAGVRLATVTTIGIASLSQLAGIPSLGSLIFFGIQNQNNEQVLAGAILISLIAVIADLLLLALQLALNRGRSALSLA